jgi:hypothetical protein
VFALEIVAQLPPSLSQRSHSYVNVGEPLHVPSFTVRVEFSCAVPVTVGGELFVGAASLAAELPATATANATAATTRPATAVRVVLLCFFIGLPPASFSRPGPRPGLQAENGAEQFSNALTAPVQGVYAAWRSACRWGSTVSRIC